MTEQELLKRVIDIAAEHDVMAFHSGDSRRDTGDNGFPDLVLAGSAGILFAELKDAYGTRTAGQTKWRYRLASAGQHCALWRPADLSSGAIEAALEWLHEDGKMPQCLREAVYSRLRACTYVQGAINAEGCHKLCANFAHPDTPQTCFR